MLSESVQCCAKHIISESREGEAECCPTPAKGIQITRWMSPPPPPPSPSAVGADKAAHFVKSLDRDAAYLSPCRHTDRYTVIVPLSSMHCKHATHTHAHTYAHTQPGHQFIPNWSQGRQCLCCGHSLSSVHLRMVCPSSTDIAPPPDAATPIKYIGVFRFPCYTSELPKPAKTVGVQLLFGLEIPV